MSALPIPGTGRVLVGGVGYRWMRDGSFGVVISDLLSTLEWPPHVDVTDLGYGAILIAQDLMYAEPRYTRLVLVAAVERGRQPGTLHACRWVGSPVSDEEIHSRIHEAGGGVVELDHLLVVARYFGVLPDDVVVFELEPADTGTGEELTLNALQRRDEVIELVRREALRPHGTASPLPPGNFQPTGIERRTGWSIRLS